jgi:hypothetical protein
MAPPVTPEFPLGGAVEVVAGDDGVDVGELPDDAAGVVSVASFKSLAATAYADAEGFALWRSLYVSLMREALRVAIGFSRFDQQMRNCSWVGMLVYVDVRLGFEIKTYVNGGIDTGIGRDEMCLSKCICMCDVP